MPRVSLPPVVYAPTLRADDDTTRIRLQRMRDDSTALFVYSALDRFEEQYGAGAGWVLLTAPQVEQVYDESPFDLLFLDRELHPAAVG